MVSQWVSWFIALFVTTVSWLSTLQILGVSVPWIMIASFLLVVMVRAFIFKP